MIPEPDVAAKVEPGGIAWQPGLGKDDESGALLRGGDRQIACMRESRGDIRRDFRLNDRDAGDRGG
jgi:hypothetical protein